MSVDGGGPDLLSAVWRYRRFVLFVSLLICAASTGVGFLLAPQASARARLALAAPSSTNVLAPGLQGDAALTRYTTQRALFVRSDPVLANAARKLPGTTVAQLRAALTATPAATSSSVALLARGGSRGQAVVRANTVVTAYREETARQVAARTSSTLAAIEANSARLRTTLAGTGSAATAQSAATALAELTRQANVLQADSAAFGDGVDFVEAATPASATGVPLPLREAALGALLGLAVACTLAWLRADRDRRVVAARQTEPVLGVPVLGELPQLRPPPTTAAGRADLTRRCRDLLAPLLGSHVRDVLLVTTAERQSGCTTTALGFAAAAAAESLRVLVVDGDPGTRGLSAALGLPAGAPGLAEAALGDADDMSSYYREVEVGPGLKIAALPAGELSGDWTVTAGGLRRLLDRLRPMFDVIVIDAPTPGSEYVSSVLLGMVDSVVVVVRSQARVSRLAELSNRFALTGPPLLGTVFTFAAARRTRQR